MEKKVFLIFIFLYFNIYIKYNKYTHFTITILFFACGPFSCPEIENKQTF